MQRQPLAASHHDRVAAGLPFVESLARRMAVDHAALDRSGRSGPGRHDRPDRCRLPLRRGARHQVRDVRRAARARRDDRRAAARRVAARRPPRSAASSKRRASSCVASSAPSRHSPTSPRASDPTKRGSAARSCASTRSNRRRRSRRLEHVDGASLPAALVPSEPQSPDKAYEQQEVRDRIRAAIASLPPRERNHRHVLLRRSDDEADWRGDWRQRIARVAAARARGAAA